MDKVRKQISSEELKVMAEDFEDLKFDILDVCEQYADDNLQSKFAYNVILMSILSSFIEVVNLQSSEEEARESLNQAIRLLQICKDPR